MNRSSLAGTTTAQLRDDADRSRHQEAAGIGTFAAPPSVAAEQAGLMPPHPEAVPTVSQAVRVDSEGSAIPWSVTLAGAALAALAALILYIGLT